MIRFRPHVDQNGVRNMAKQHHKPEQIIGKLREAEVELAKGTEAERPEALIQLLPSVDEVRLGKNRVRNGPS